MLLMSVDGYRTIKGIKNENRSTTIIGISRRSSCSWRRWTSSTGNETQLNEDRKLLDGKLSADSPVQRLMLLPLLAASKKNLSNTRQCIAQLLLQKVALINICENLKRCLLSFRKAFIVSAGNVIGDNIVAIR